jgi:two-component system, LytTR family, response regulator
MTIRTLIADDEPLARERLVTLLRDEPDFEVVAECGDGFATADAIRRLSPQLVFLDIQMPSGDGFNVLDRLEDSRRPLVIFVTAYDAHALKAFDVHALDYLLKPFDRQRFQRALDRVREEVAQIGAVAAPGPPAARVTRFVIKHHGRVFFLKAREIDWVEAAGNYAILHARGESHMVRQTMAGLEAQLDGEVFFRIHRSTIVNIDRIKELQPLFNGEFLVMLQDGARLTLSRGYRDKVKARLGHDF